MHRLPGHQLARQLAPVAAGVVLVVVLDLLAGPGISLIGLLVVVPLLAALRFGPRVTAAVMVAATAVALGLGLLEGVFGSTDHLTRVLTVLGGGVVGIWAARLRAARERAVRLLAIQGAVSRVLNESHTLAEAGPRVLCVIGEAMGLQVGAIWSVAPGGEILQREERWSATSVEARAFDAAGEDTTFRHSVGLPSTVLETGEPVLVPDLRDAEGLRRAPAAAEAGLGTGLAFPIPSGGEVIGVVELFGAKARVVGAAEVRMLAGLGPQIGVYIERTRAYEERTYIARTLQDSLLPPNLPEIPGVEVAARYHAAGEENEVGGDFYDLFQTGGSSWAAVIGDVQGKGPDAAAMIGLARHTLRAGAMRDSDPGRVLRGLNEALSMEGGDDSFCTALLATISYRHEGVEVELTSAGHPLPLVLRSDGDVETVGAPGTLVGAVSELDLNPEHVSLRPGDALVLFTDGVHEAGSGPDRFGQERLEGLLRECRGATATDVATRIERDVLAFQGGEPGDDMAVLVLRRQSPVGSSRERAQVAETS